MTPYGKIVGHQDIIDYIEKTAASDSPAHAYIFSGERGSGKKLLSNLFAMALECSGEGRKPCMECHSCRQAKSGNHPDIIWVKHERPQSVGVDDIREQIVSDIEIRPYSSPYKIYIVDEAEKMTVQAQNALLKTIEEPPSYGIIILLTTNADILLPTVRSRCIQLKLKNIKDSLIRKYLCDELLADEDRADICTAFAQGNLGRAIMLAKSEYFNEIMHDAVHLLKYIKEMELYEIVDALKEIGKYKLEISDYLDIISIWYRDILLFKATNDVNRLIFHDEVKYIKEQAEKSSYAGIENILEALDKAKVRLAANVNFDTVMELLLWTIKEN